MKKKIRNQFSNGIKKNILRFSLAGIFFAGLASGSANAQTKPASVALVNYIGDMDGQPVFQVALDNQSGKVYNLTIKDQEGTVFYTERFAQKNFTKKFRFDKADHDDVNLTFILSSPTEKDQVFQVNTNVQVLKDVVVTRL